MSNAFFSSAGAVRSLMTPVSMNPFTARLSGQWRPKYGGAGALRSQPGGDGIVDRSARSACQRIGSRRRAGMGVISLNADDLSFLNTLLGEGEVSVRIQHPDGVKARSRDHLLRPVAGTPSA